MYLCLVIVWEFLTNSVVVPDPLGNLKKMQAFNLSARGLLSSFPLIMFSFMSQINIPSIFSELENKTEEKMSQIMIRGNLAITFFYILAGIFGYATFLGPPINYQLCS